jgi:S1-C subfamily serine protease
MLKLLKFATRVPLYITFNIDFAMKLLSRFIFLILCLNTLQTQAQSDKVYFDRIGKSTSEVQAYYYRAGTDKPNEYKSYYINGGALYFEGTITKPSFTDEATNTYSGTCTWYFKSGKKMSIRSFNETGAEHGTSTWYYESGKIWKEIEYKNGKIVGSMFKEFDENGKISEIFEDKFIDNTNDWDLYTSDKTSATIEGGTFSLTSFTKEGAARYIYLTGSSDDFILESTINITKLGYYDKAGLIFNLKDWKNYSFFLISSTSFYIGSVYEGVTVTKANGMFSSEIKKAEPNVLKVFGSGEKNIYTINGTVQYSTERTNDAGNNYGFSLSGKGTVKIEDFIFKKIGYKGATSVSGTTKDLDVKGTGSGIFISTGGYIVTNHHVIEDANKVQVEVNENGSPKTYNAKVVSKDEDNDVAILKIEDEAFKPLTELNYSFVESGSANVGASVFTIGFPYALTGMGKEAKFTDGKISAKTGYNGSINSYQTSVPVQPGNSGGPLFNEKGELIAIVNSGIMAADNVSYAIKVNYIKNLMELLPDSPAFPSNKSLLTVTTKDKVKVITQYVVLIKIK